MGWGHGRTVPRAATELARDWRWLDGALRRLEAMMLQGDE